MDCNIKIRNDEERNAVLRKSTTTRNRFEKYPKITLASVISAGVLLCALILIVICYFIKKQAVSETDIFNMAFTYRTVSPIFHHGFKENQSLENATWGELRYTIRTNSLGFRDVAVRTVPLMSGHYRILFMGDSFTEGIGVNYQDSFVGIIADALAADGVEVLNASAVSYSPIIYWRKIKYLIETVGLKFNEVVIFLDISDAQDEVVSYYLDEDGHVKSRLMEDKAIGRQIAQRLRKEQPTNSLEIFMAILKDFWPYPLEETGRWTFDPSQFEKIGKPGLQQMALYMDRLRKMLEAHGIKMKVAVYPWPIQIAAGDLNSIHATYWENWCERSGVDFLNYFPVFCATNEAPQEKKTVIHNYFIEGDTHWNREGHRLIARVFLERFGETYRKKPLESKGYK